MCVCAVVLGCVWEHRRAARVASRAIMQRFSVFIALPTCRHGRGFSAPFRLSRCCVLFCCHTPPTCWPFFPKVYWNSRLEAEHRRLVDTFAKGQVVIDVMAGIGPFAVPAAKRGCTVLANDLNPESFRWLRANLATNKVTKTASAFNLDGRDFIRLVCATPGGPADALLGRAHDATAAAAAAAAGTSGTTAADDAAGPIPARFQLPQQGLFFHHAVMNLPALAVEFLDAFRGAFDPGLWRKDGVSLPMVHCYTFMKAPETEADVVAKVEKFLGGKLDEAPAVHVVRDVAPSKLMLCVSFRVPRAVAFCGRDGGSAEQPGSADAEVAADDGVDITISSKRQKTDQYE